MPFDDFVVGLPSVPPLSTISKSLGSYLRSHASYEQLRDLLQLVDEKIPFSASLLPLVVAVIVLLRTFPRPALKGSQRSLTAHKIDLDREESLGQALVRHLRSIQSHSISFSPQEVEPSFRNKGKTGLLKRLAGRLHFGLKDSSRAAEDPPAYRRGWSRSFRRNSEVGAPSSRSSTSSIVRSSAHGGVLDALLVGLRRPYQSFGGRRSKKSGRPGMTRIVSGTSLNVADGCAPSSVSEVTGEGNLRVPRSSAIAYNGHLAADCLGHDMTDASYSSAVNQIVTEDHLLQLGSLMGESSSQLALSQRSAPGPISSDPASLFGALDANASSQLDNLHTQGIAGWELVVEEHKPSVHYWAWRHALRKGLYIYRSRTVFEKCTTAEMTAFHFQPYEQRRRWDDSLAEMIHLPPPEILDMDADSVEEKTYARSAFVYARTKFPPPMAQREYVYARRVWRKPDDGGCYIVTLAGAHPAPPPAGCRSLLVSDLCSGTVIRAVPGIYSSEGAVEVVTNYYEDSKVSARIINMGVRKAMWPVVQKSEKGLREFKEQHYNAAEHERLMAAKAAKFLSLPPRVPTDPLVSVAPLKTKAPLLDPTPTAPRSPNSLLDLTPKSAGPAVPCLRLRHSMADIDGMGSPKRSPTRHSFFRSASLESKSLSTELSTNTSVLSNIELAGTSGMTFSSFLLSNTLAGSRSPRVEALRSQSTNGAPGAAGGAPLSAESSSAQLGDSDSLPVIPASWGDYHPELTRRFHFTPVLYHAYLAAYGNASSAAQAAASLSQSMLKSLWQAHVVAWQLFKSSLCTISSSGLTLVGAATGRMGQVQSHGLRSHPISSQVHFRESDAAPGAESGGASGRGRSSSGGGGRKAHWSKRLFVRVTSLAVKAVGVPLAHHVLSGNLPPPSPPPGRSSSTSEKSASGGGRGTRQGPGSQPGSLLKLESHRPVSQRAESQRAVRQMSPHHLQGPRSGSQTPSAEDSRDPMAFRSHPSMHKVSQWPLLLAERESFSRRPPRPISSESSFSSVAGSQSEDGTSAAPGGLRDGGRPQPPKRYLI